MFQKFLADSIAQALKRFFGTDTISFTTCSTTLPVSQTCNDASPVIRSYTSFSQAADENGVSRIFVGFHFRDASQQGSNTAVKSPIMPSTLICDLLINSVLPACGSASRSDDGRELADTNYGAPCPLHVARRRFAL